jgi:signal peptidase I
MLKRRRPIGALLLSIIAVGLGQLYNGKVKKAGIFLIAFYVGGPALSIFLLDSFEGAVALLCVALAAVVYIAIDAFRDARSQEMYDLKPYNRWYVYLVYYILLSVGVQEGISIAIKKYCFEAFKFPSGSMKPTLQPGDNLIVKKLWLSQEKVLRGDIVVFTRESDPEVNILKRVVGLPGETIEVRDSTVFINSEPLPESYAHWDQVDDPVSYEFPAQKIPADSIFVLGDNRHHSKDSRFFDPPFIPLNRVKGKAQYIYWYWEGGENRLGKRLDQ